MVVKSSHALRSNWRGTGRPMKGCGTPTPPPSAARSLSHPCGSGTAGVHGGPEPLPRSGTPPRAGIPRWPPRGGATPTRCTGLVRRGLPPSPLVAAWPWPCHPWRLVRSSCWDSRRRKSQRGRQEGEERCRYRERMFQLGFAPLLSDDPPALFSPAHHSAAASLHRARVARPAAHGTPDTPPYRWPAAAPLRPKCRNRPPARAARTRCNGATAP